MPAPGTAPGQRLGPGPRVPQPSTRSRSLHQHHHHVAGGGTQETAAQGPGGGDGPRGHDVRVQGVRPADRQPLRGAAHTQDRIQRAHVHGLPHHVPVHPDLRVRPQLQCAVPRQGPAGPRVLLLHRLGHGHAGRALPRRQGARQRHGHRAGRAGPGGAHRAPVRRLHVRVRGQVGALPGAVRARPGRRSAAAAAAAPRRGEAGHGAAVAQVAGERPLHPGGGRRHHVRQHGHRHAGALAAHLDDGHDGRGALAAGRHLPARLHLVPHRHQPVRAPRPPHGPLAGGSPRTHHHRNLPDVYPAGAQHQPPDRAQRRPGLRHRHGGQLHDARAGLPGRHPPLGRLRLRLRHRGRGLLPGLRHRPGAQRHPRQHHRLRVDAVRHRHPQPVLRAAPVLPQEPADQGREQVLDPGGEVIRPVRHLPERRRGGVEPRKRERRRRAAGREREARTVGRRAAAQQRPHSDGRGETACGRPAGCRLTSSTALIALSLSHSRGVPPGRGRDRVTSSARALHSGRGMNS